MYDTDQITRDLQQQHFTGTVWRPPYEAHSILLQTTIGCTHRACRFCSLYGDLRFRMATPEEIRADLQLIARYQPRARRIFLVGANPFVLSYDRLVRLSDTIRTYLPKIQTIGMFARISDIRTKTPEQLRDLRSRGITGISIGTETGDDPTLARMNKGTTAEEIYEQCRKLDEAGIEYYFTYMTGLAGAGNGRRAACATAALFNRLHPYIVTVVSLTLFPDAPLWNDVQTGLFREAGERERLEELHTFLSELRIPTTLMANTVSNTIPLMGRMPDDRTKLLRTLDQALARIDEPDLAAYRRNIEHL